MSKKEMIDYNILFKFFDQKATLEEKAMIKKWEQDANNLSLIEDAYQIWLEQNQTNMSLGEDQAQQVFTENRKKYTRHLFRKTLTYSILIAIAFVVVGSLLVIKYDSYQSSLLCVIKATNNNSGNTDIWLSDSTHIVLSRGSSFKIWEEQNNDQFRAIRLRGKAFFEVAKNREKPFLVETGTDMVVKVLGTSFVLNTDSSSFDLGLISGKVELVESEKLTERNTHAVVVKPGQVAHYKSTEKQNVVEMDSLNVSIAMRWTKPMLNLKSASLGNVLDNLSAWYAVDVECSQLLREKYICTIQISEEPLEQVLDILQIMLPLKISKNDQKIYIQDR